MLSRVLLSVEPLLTKRVSVDLISLSEKCTVFGILPASPQNASSENMSIKKKKPASTPANKTNSANKEPSLSQAAKTCPNSWVALWSFFVVLLTEFCYMSPLF